MTDCFLPQNFSGFSLSSTIYLWIGIFMKQLRVYNLPKSGAWTSSPRIDLVGDSPGINSNHRKRRFCMKIVFVWQVSGTPRIDIFTWQVRVCICLHRCRTGAKCLAILISLSYYRYATNIDADKKIPEGIQIFPGCFSILPVQALI